MNSILNLLVSLSSSLLVTVCLLHIHVQYMKNMKIVQNVRIMKFAFPNIAGHYNLLINCFCLSGNVTYFASIMHYWQQEQLIHLTSKFQKSTTLKHCSDMTWVNRGIQKLEKWSMNQNLTFQRICVWCNVCNTLNLNRLSFNVNHTTLNPSCKL